MNGRTLCLGAALICGLFAGQFLNGLSLAQTTPADASAGSSPGRRGPLPFYFAKLGLSDAQKETLYGIQEQYEEKLEPVREQLKKLVRERDEKMESLLTAGQKLRLKELREEALKRGEKLESEPGTSN